MLYPKVRIWGLAFNWIPLHITALYALGGWILFQIVSAVLDPQGHVGWWAHLGGLGAGAALTPIFIHRGVTLFGRGRVKIRSGPRLWRR
jgi:membrane associated rhomboid family serine protease